MNGERSFDKKQVRMENKSKERKSRMEVKVKLKVGKSK